MLIQAGNSQFPCGGGGGPAEPARHHTGKKHACEESGRHYRRGDLGSEAESAGTGAGAAGL